MAKTIRSAGYCMDVYRGIRKNNNPIIAYPCHKGPNQRFSYQSKTKRIRSSYSRKCLDIHKGRVVQRNCSRTRKSQQWNRDGKRRFRSLYNNQCIDVEGGNYRKGALITYPCHGGPNQRWNVSR
jgi:hypothetical protein